MTKIIIATPSYSTEYGGIIVLHKLCHILNEVGFDSYVIDYTGNNQQLNLNPNFNTKNINIKEVDTFNDIIVYPEITVGNPYNFKKCVRYLLYYSSKKNIHYSWGSEDFWIYYRNEFYDSIKEYNILTVVDTKVDFFKNLNYTRDIDSCYLIRKGNDYDHISKNYHPPNSLYINHNDDLSYLNIFNRCKRFFSYDYNTYVNSIAALCGCESIIVPLKNLHINDFNKTNPDRLYGIAYGLEDIDNCKNANILRDYLYRIENNQYNDVKSMFNKVVNYFKI
jgi:hypothetical protein